MLLNREGVNYELNEDKFTSKIISSDDAKGNITIPPSIVYKLKFYVITELLECAFQFSKIKELKFSDLSTIRLIPRDAFHSSSIEYLHLPPSLEELEEGWCQSTPKLTKITVSEDNEFLKNYNDQLLIGKSKKDENYDILYFASRTIEEITIPATIKQINSYSFEYCKKLTNVKFTENSQLKIIQSNSFVDTDLEELEIPDEVEYLDENFCYLSTKLKKLKISTNNQNFVNIGDKIIISKSEEENYDVFCFISPNVDTVVIPSEIIFLSRFRLIESWSLKRLIELKEIEIENEKLKLLPILQNIPKNYEFYLNKIQNEIMKKAYSKFKFKYFKFDEFIKSEKVQIDDEIAAFYLFFYLINFKFIVFSITMCKNNTQKMNCVFFIENECIIVEQINTFVINEIIKNLNKYQIKMIDVSQNIKIQIDLHKDEAKEEIEAFKTNFMKEIKNNSFIKYTIDPLVGYLIHRYDCPSDYFNDRTFFIFNKFNITKEWHIKQKLNDYLLKEIGFNEKKIKEELESISNEIKSSKNEINEFNCKQEFKESDFIILRTLYQKEGANYLLVMQADTFYIFMLERIINSKISKKMVQRIEKIYSNPHRCITPIYGLIKEDNKIVDVIYEYMSNGPLNKYISKFNNIKAITTSIRIFQGIEHLHKKGLIHRDLKPSNILIDHDGLAYISDFETIRSNDLTDGTFTLDYGLNSYSSPEQDE